MKRTQSDSEKSWAKENKRLDAAQRRRLKKSHDENPFYHGKNISTQPSIFDAPVAEPALTPVQLAARALGALGGKSRSAAKVAAARRNGKRPKTFPTSK